MKIVSSRSGESVVSRNLVITSSNLQCLINESYHLMSGGNLICAKQLLFRKTAKLTEKNVTSHRISSQGSSLYICYFCDSVVWSSRSKRAEFFIQQQQYSLISRPGHEIIINGLIGIRILTLLSQFCRCEIFSLYFK